MAGGPIPQNSEPSSPPGSINRSGQSQWTLIPHDETHHYRTTSTSIIDLAGIHDTIKTNSTFNLEVQNRGPRLTVKATFDTVGVQTSSQVESSPRSSASSLQITGYLENSILELDDTSLPDCNNQSILIPILEHVISKPPVNLHLGMTWTDTLSMTACSGGIPVTLTSIRNYQIIGERNIEGLEGIEITRTDKTALTGESEQGQHRVGISSTSTGSAQLFIDRQSGSLLRSTGQYSGAVTIITSGRRQVFNQTVQETVDRM